MKKLILPLAALLFSVGALHAQSTTPQNKSKTPPTTTQKPANAQANGAQQNMASQKTGNQSKSKSVTTTSTTTTTDKNKPKKSMAKSHKHTSKKSSHHT